eukprot:CAMPEP_0174730066 /NCGR_PEP_ID=MMETSP1094-20130205/54853_1 /TAXON_ID=156173 /ORGANISM="Chrysochromulina brevifilum, Strain UTEX LB 985" /LENGTH=122 /DNA_ID=CAMNT_0015932265 /DNA_START=251 /DNA_END=620 /DNA_ORIENTATION=-
MDGHAAQPTEEPLHVSSPLRVHAGSAALCAFGRVALEGDWAAPTLLLVIIGFVGVSNGLVGTLAFIRAQAMVDEADQELGSRIMVLALYCGIAAGSTFAALVFRNDTSGGGGTINGTVNGAP